MTDQSNPIDDLIDQIDENEQTITCIKCLCHAKRMLPLSCNHVICISCMEISINDKNYKNCPGCSNPLMKDLNKIYSEYLENPISKLEYFYDMNVGDLLWYYTGNGHNWLYSKQHCNELNTVYEKYAEEGHDDPDDCDYSTIELQIGSQTYVVDLASLCQYPKNAPNKSRGISSFKLKSINDLKKNKIIGVAGKLL